ncbi:tyrosine-type recombinase/integrase [Natronosalvus vescus]|uniref:tyrosine-type recombinase/integrase n=1 Tax=Natronosalvus vescus TaxID=2953881 RepID=UPI002090FC59|nr:site-specific integrase [Natronosalvus vescus]
MAVTQPRKVSELFIREREGERAKATIYKDRDVLNQFTTWCENNQIDSIRDLDGTVLLEYKLFLQDDPNKADSTIRNHFSTLRTYFRFCRRIDATREDQHLYEKLKTPDFAKGELSRDDMMETERVKELLEYLRKFEYASSRHTMFIVFWHTGCRRGALRGLDLHDYERVKQREHGKHGVLKFRHRPDTDTPLKNKASGQREVIVWPSIGEIIEDYIDTKRIKIEDENGRKPLITSSMGRYAISSIQRQIYGVTRPCYYSNSCPHGREIENCEAYNYNKSNKCPSSLSPHPMRRTAITYHLEEKDWTYEAASGRFDVSQKILDEHYDESTDEGRMKTRASMHFDGDQGVI